VEHLDVVSFNPQGQNYFSRRPVSSDEEAIYVSGDYREHYESALVASGFRQNRSTRAFTPCPLGTFTKPFTKGDDACQECKPGNKTSSFFLQSSEEMLSDTNLIPHSQQPNYVNSTRFRFISFSDYALQRTLFILSGQISNRLTNTF